MMLATVVNLRVLVGTVNQPQYLSFHTVLKHTESKPTQFYSTPYHVSSYRACTLPYRVSKRFTSMRRRSNSVANRDGFLTGELDRTEFPIVSVCRTAAAAVSQDFETKKAAGALTLGAFDQRPYFRILLNLLDGMNKPDRQLDNSNLQASLENT